MRKMCNIRVQIRVNLLKEMENSFECDIDLRSFFFFCLVKKCIQNLIVCKSALSALL